MESEFVKFMEDEQGQRSSMRLMCLLALCTAIVLSLVKAYMWTQGALLGTDNELILYLLMAAFGGKTAQKFAEDRK